MSEYAVEIERMTVKLENLFMDSGNLSMNYFVRIENVLNEMEQIDRQELKVVNEWWINLQEAFKRLNRNYQDYLREFYSGKSDKVLKSIRFNANNDRGYNNIAVIENKMYNTQFKEIKQLLGYINIHVKLGITITINKKKKLVDVIEALRNYIENEKNNLHIVQVEKKKEYLLHTTMKNQQDDTTINCYHFVLSLNDEEHEKWAKEIRNI